MKRPNREDYLTGKNDFCDIIDIEKYALDLDKYVNYIEDKQQLSIPAVVNCCNCNSTNIARESIYRCKECNCFHDQSGAQL